MMLVPLDNERILDAVLGKSWCFFDGTERVCVIGWERVHRALITRCHIGNDHAGLTLEALSATINEECCDTFLAFSWVIYLMYHGVDPATCLNIIKACNDNLELTEEFFVEVLYRVCVGRYGHSLYAVHDELSGDMRLILANVIAAE